MSQLQTIEVDVIIPVHNAADTVKETLFSALNQEIPTKSSPSLHSPSPLLHAFLEKYTILITVCCYDDGSSDESLEILREIESSRSKENKQMAGERSSVISSDGLIPSRIIVQSSKDGKARGAGYARNRAIEMNNPFVRDGECSKVEAESNRTNNDDHADGSSYSKFLCFLDSDDVMHKHRVIEQVLYMFSEVDEEARDRTILGCTFDRDPPDSTWHYSSWANNLSTERLVLEKYREITILQPTWFMPLTVWSMVGGYIEAPPQGSGESLADFLRVYQSSSSSQPPRLVHPKYDTMSSIRLAEDLRFFHSHLQSGGELRLHRTSLAAATETTPYPLVTYRHTGNDQSQSFRTSRKLLLQLRALAFQIGVIRANPNWEKFVIWGCGRDGKDFYKALDEELQGNVYCFVDVDAKKLNAGYYVDSTPNRAVTADRKGKKKKVSARKIPIVHYSFLISNENERKTAQTEWTTTCSESDEVVLGRIDKSKAGSAGTASEAPPAKKKRKTTSSNSRSPELHIRELDQELLSRLPVVVCVAMYRTNGVLERNVARIGRKEGETLWHFS